MIGAFGLVVGGLALAIWGSRVVVDRAAKIVAGLGVPPFLVGILLFALGTDLPEIANSIVSSVSGHGDLNVGDSVGSAVVQSTLVLGLLAFFGRPSTEVERRDVVSTGLVTVAGLGLVALAASDGWLGRLNGLGLVAVWVIGSFVVARVAPPEQLELHEGDGTRPSDVLGALGALALVAGGAIAAVQGLVDLAESMGLSEFVIGFFLASVGTSLPELVVNLRAMRRGETTMAMGGVLGASMLDATVSVGAGPLVAPVAVTASAAVPGALGALVALAVVGAVLAFRRRHDRWSGALFLVLYAAMFPVLAG